MSRVDEPNRPEAVRAARRRATGAGGLEVSKKHRFNLDRYRANAPYYTIGEIAILLGVSRATAHKYQRETGIMCREYRPHGRA